MKVLYLGHYKEFGGWSQAATDNILALDNVGVDVVCRNVTLTQDKQEIHPRLLQLEEKNSRGCDVCVQHVLPHHYVRSDMFKKNIAFMETETLNLKHLNWFYQLNMMDEVWVANESSKKALESDGLTPQIKVIHHTTDTSKYKKRYLDLSIPQTEGTFKFYYIGDFNDRKNLESIITCFHSEFEEDENVSLVLKFNKFGLSSEELHGRIIEYLSQIKKSLRIRNSYKQEVIVTDKLPEESLMSLHNYCDCFVCPSHGEAWSIPSLDAMAFGNTPIASNFGGPCEFIDKNNWRTGTLINGVYSCCKSKDAAFPDLFTSKEYWFQPCEKQIRGQMRKYYESWKKDPISYEQRNRVAGLKQVEKFSYQNIGKILKEQLNDV
jgi:glycosyltransferase involved in cell wall biosynthesis